MSEEQSSSGSRNVKTKETVKDIRVFDHANDLTNHARETYIRTKNRTQSMLDESYEDSADYAVTQSKEITEGTVHNTRRAVQKGNKKVKDQVEKRLRRHFEKKQSSQEYTAKKTSYEKKFADRKTIHATRSKSIKRPVNTTARSIKTTARSSGKTTVKTARHTVKGINHTIKTAETSAKASVKTAQQTAKAAAKSAQATAKTAQTAAVTAQKAAVAAKQAAEATVRAIIAAVKATITAIKGVITALSAGTVITLPIIILGAVIIGVAVLLTGDTRQVDGPSNTGEAIWQINSDYQAQLDALQDRFSADEVKIMGTRPRWEEVVAIYTAKSAAESVSEWDEYNGMSFIFWDMVSISYKVEAQVPGETAVELPESILIRSVEISYEYIGKGYMRTHEAITYQREENEGGLLPEEWEGKDVSIILTISVNTKSVEEICEQYGFSDYQKEQVEVLLSEDLAEFWLDRIYGYAGSDEQIVNVALTQVGNTGGYPYWAYVGFPSRVEWCACFVSWCAGQCGYIEQGLIPNTGSPEYQVAWFQQHNHWQDGSITPTTGMIIFYDWYGKNFPDHVGIVERVENGIVYTVEGNSGDAVRQRQYPVGDSRILGYGWITDLD